jgi:hypothetical protein
MAHANSAYLETFSPTQDTDIQDLEILQANHFEEPHAFASVYALVGSTGPDTLTFAEAMRAEDLEDFIKAIHAQRTRRSHRKETLEGCADWEHSKREKSTSNGMGDEEKEESSR